MSNQPANSEIYLTTAQSREVDRLAIEKYSMPGILLMENAGRGMTDLLVGLGISGPVHICCGKGNNAGDGFVLARHLDFREFSPIIHLFAPPEELQGDALINYEIIRKSDLRIRHWKDGFAAKSLENDLSGADWIVDALLGTGVRGKPRPPLDKVIDCINNSGKKVLAVDLPSGLDCETGNGTELTIRALHTCTFVAKKTGYRQEQAKEFLGTVHVQDIGCPRRIIDEVLQG